MKYLIWLRETACVSAEKCARLLAHYGSGEAVYRANPAKAAQTCGLSGDEQRGLAAKSLAKAERILGACKQAGIEVMTIFDEQYPQRLKNIFDPPPVLYIRGRLPDFNRLPSISVVGQREATPYGLAAAEKLGFQLGAAGFIVVSGMAKGIDGASHTGAVKAGALTVAVFGTAIDVCYPTSNMPLLRQILQKGAVISEYPPGTVGKAWFFPVRNRIISGLSLGTVIVEAGVRSGSLITSNHALDQGRDVFAVPGPINAESSEGTNDLIKKGAKLISNAGDIIDEYAPLYGLERAPAVRERLLERAKAPTPAPKPQPASAALRLAMTPAFEPTGDPVLDALSVQTHIDALAERLEMPQARLLARLTLLEIEGKIRQLPGKHFERIQ